MLYLNSVHNTPKCINLVRVVCMIRLWYKCLPFCSLQPPTIVRIEKLKIAYKILSNVNNTFFFTTLTVST